MKSTREFPASSMFSVVSMLWITTPTAEAEASEPTCSTVIWLKVESRSGGVSQWTKADEWAGIDCPSVSQTTRCCEAAAGAPEQARKTRPTIDTKPAENECLRDISFCCLPLIGLC